MSPEGQGHRLTDSLATSDQAEKEKTSIIIEQEMKLPFAQLKFRLGSRVYNKLFGESRS